MELQEFRSEIEKKFVQSKLNDFKFPKMKEQKSTIGNRIHTAESHSHKRGHSTEEGVLMMITETGVPSGYGKSIIQENDTICKTS